MRSEAERAGLSASCFASGTKMCPAALTEKKFAPPHHPSILQAEWHGEESPGEPEIVRLLGKRRWGMSASPSYARRLCACTGGLRHREERMQSHRDRRRPCLPDKALPAPGTRDEKSPEGGSAQEPQEGRVCTQACSLKACPIQRHKRRREALLPLRGALCRLAVARGLIEGSSRLGEDGGGDRDLALRQP